MVKTGIGVNNRFSTEITSHLVWFVSRKKNVYEETECSEKESLWVTTLALIATLNLPEISWKNRKWDPDLKVAVRKRGLIMVHAAQPHTVSITFAYFKQSFDNISKRRRMDI